MTVVSDLHVVDALGAVLTVTVATQRFDLHAMWLRDACTCGECRRPASNERLVDIDSISPDLTILSAHLDNGRLTVELSDGHHAIIDSLWLRDHLASGDMSDNPAHGCLLWDATEPDVIGAWHREALNDVNALRDWFESFGERAVASVQVHASGEPGLRSVAELLGPIRHTNYGDVWMVDATIEPVTAVDSERSLLVHTDLPYRDNAPGIQLMMVENDGVEGGASTFVDGFAAAERLRAVDPEAWRLLTTVEFSYPFVRHDIHMRLLAPLVRLRTNGAYAEVRRAPDLVGVPRVGAVDTPALYRAVRVWNRLLDGGEFEVRHAVRPGEVIVWNNHRVLHGRTAFELGAHGRRVLFGCYVDADDFRSSHALVAQAATT